MLQRPHPKRISPDRESELEKIIQELRDALSKEISNSNNKETWIAHLEKEALKIEREINRKDLEILASNEEKESLQADITALKIQLNHIKKESQDKETHIAELEKQIQECNEIISSLKYRIKQIHSRRNSPDSTNIANMDLFISMNRGLNRLERHFRREGQPLNNPANLVQGIQGTLNTIRTNYQSKDQDLDYMTNQRDDRDNQITQLQQDINYYRQLDRDNQDQINDLTQQLQEIQQRYLLRGNAWINASLMWEGKTNQQNRCIVLLLAEKFASQILNNRLVNNLNQQIFTLQNNNPHQNNISSIVGYLPSEFDGAPGKDPEDFINDLRRYVVAM